MMVTRRRPLQPTLFPYTTLFRSRWGGGADLCTYCTRLWPFLSGQGGEMSLTIDDLCQRSRYRRNTAHVVPARSDHTGLGDRKSTRLNSSHGYISYAVFCLKKKNI